MSVTRLPASNGRVAGQHLVGDHGERVDVGGRRDRVTAHLLGCRVGQRADEQRRIGEARLVARRLHGGEAEINHLVDALARLVAVDDDVGGLEVAVRDAAVVGQLQRGGHRRQDGGDAGRRHRRLQLDLLAQAWAAQQFHHHERLVGGVEVEVENADDVRVAQLGAGAALAQEALARLGRRGVRPPASP